MQNINDVECLRNELVEKKLKAVENHQKDF